jgi:hypothetical protein
MPTILIQGRKSLNPTAAMTGDARQLKAQEVAWGMTC